MNGLLNGHEGSDPYLGKPLNRLNNDLNVFALLVRAGKKRQRAQFRQHSSQFGLENHKDRDHNGREKSPQQILKLLQVEQKTDECKSQQNDHETRDHRSAARAAKKTDD